MKAEAKPKKPHKHLKRFLVFLLVNFLIISLALLAGMAFFLATRISLAREGGLYHGRGEPG